MRCMMIAVFVFALMAPAFTANVEEGILYVDGSPFFPLGGWDNNDTAAEELALFGMNTSFRGGPRSPEAVEQLRGFMRECNACGVQVIPYLSYGGAGVTPWPEESVRNIAKLGSEPNLLGWYVGDDITMKHLDGIRQTVGILREETPDLPIVADYIADATPEAKTVFTQYIDIRCQYDYPIPDKSFAEYLTFFDEQREFVGDPLWTWVQSFMWETTGTTFNVGAEGPGPIPDPEQVRLLAFAAVNRGVRGLLFFPHHELVRLPELAGEVGLVCREIRLFAPQLAAGTISMNLTASDPDVNASAFAYQGSVVVSAALFKDTYHRWVDEAQRENLEIEIPWTGAEPPQALLVAVPEVIECAVASAQTPGYVRVTLPKFELAHFLLLSRDEGLLQTLRENVPEIPRDMAPLIVPAAAAQARKVSGVAWQLGVDHLYKPTEVRDATRSVHRCSAAVVNQDFGQAFAAWRDSLRECRRTLDTLMEMAQSRAPRVPAGLRRYLENPYGLHNVHGLFQAPDANDPWRFITTWEVTGPYPLDWDGQLNGQVAPGFLRAYPPETGEAAQVRWQPAQAALSGCLDLLPCFGETDNVVAYARCTLSAPRDMTVQLGLGSNDGVKLWLNGQEIFAWSGTAEGGRKARPQENVFEVHLKQGENTVLAKVENLGAAWQLYLAFHDAERQLSW